MIGVHSHKCISPRLKSLWSKTVKVMTRMNTRSTRKEGRKKEEEGTFALALFTAKEL